MGDRKQPTPTPAGQVKPAPPPAPPPPHPPTIRIEVLADDPRHYHSTDEWRIRRADHARLDTPSRPTAGWAAKELVFWCTMAAPANAYHVVLSTPLGLTTSAVSPCGGRRVVHLLYEWAECIEPYLHLEPGKLSTEVLQVLGNEGNMLRAGIAYAASRSRLL